MPLSCEFILQVVGNDSDLSQILASGNANHEEAHLYRFNQRLFQNLTSAIRTLPRLFQNVIRHARLRACYSVQNPIKRNLGAFLIAGLTGFNQVLSLAQSGRVDENYNLLFRSGIEEVARHSEGILASEGMVFRHFSDIPTNRLLSRTLRGYC